MQHLFTVLYKRVVHAVGKLLDLLLGYNLLRVCSCCLVGSCGASYVLSCDSDEYFVYLGAYVCFHGLPDRSYAVEDILDVLYFTP